MSLMHADVIASVNWGRFFEDVTRRHAHEQVRVELLDLDAGLLGTGEVHPLQRIGLGPTAAGFGTVSIAVEGDRGQSIRRVVYAPVEVKLTHADGGTDEAIAIRSADGSTTVVHLIPDLT